MDLTSKTYGPPVPGMIGLTTISGNVGRLIRLGQRLNGEGFYTWEHAFVLLPGNYVLEAEPGGAVIRPLHYENVYWCCAIYDACPSVKAASPTLLSDTAQKFKGIKYSFADYAALAAHRLHLPVPGLRDFIEDDGHEICSQMCDDYYQRLGGQIFDDGRWNGYVTPASLYNRDVQLELLSW